MREGHPGAPFELLVDVHGVLLGAGGDVDLGVERPIPGKLRMETMGAAGREFVDESSVSSIPVVGDADESIVDPDPGLLGRESHADRATGPVDRSLALEIVRT